MVYTVQITYQKCIKSKYYRWTLKITQVIKKRKSGYLKFNKVANCIYNLSIILICTVFMLKEKVYYLSQIDSMISNYFQYLFQYLYMLYLNALPLLSGMLDPAVLLLSLHQIVDFNNKSR